MFVWLWLWFFAASSHFFVDVFVVIIQFSKESKNCIVVTVDIIQSVKTIHDLYICFCYASHRIRVYGDYSALHLYIIFRCTRIILFPFQFFLLVCYLQRKYTKTRILTDVISECVCECEGVRVCEGVLVCSTCVRTYVQIIFVYFAHQAFCLICLFDFVSAQNAVKMLKKGVHITGEYSTGNTWRMVYIKVMKLLEFVDLKGILIKQWQNVWKIHCIFRYGDNIEGNLGPNRKIFFFSLTFYT